jgi:ElaB/YqjD/DUF883 family membrane-anchored ribosome-binding protein
MAKNRFDIKTEATRPLYAGVGVTDLAVGLVREYVADVQKRVSGVQKDVATRVTDLEPKALREQVVTLLGAGVDALSNDAKARRTAIEARIAELQADARALPSRVQALLDENAGTVNGTYAELAKRGETLVERIRRQPSTQAAVSAAETTVAKAKATSTQATKAAKKVSTTAKKSAAAPRSSAKATGTSAKKAASDAAQAATDGTGKVGD